MYLKVLCSLELPELARVLAPDEAFELGREGDTEWLIVAFPEAPCALKFVREPSDRTTVTILGWDPFAGREVDELPDWLVQAVADGLLTTVQIHAGKFGRSGTEASPAEIVRPHLLA